MKQVNRQFGFSLVELLVTLVISSILLLGTINVLINNFSLSRANDRYSRLNENITAAVSFISDDLEMVGFTGCGQAIINNLAAAGSGDLLEVSATGVSGPELMFLDGLDDSNKVWSRFGTNQIAPLIVDGTDAITIRKLRNQGALITADMGAANAAITADLSADNLAVNDLIAVYDCQSLDIAQATSTGASISHGGLSKAYSAAVNANDNIIGQAGRVAVFDSIRYYIGADANGQPGLWREVFNANAVVQQELIKGVSNMQILYGVTTPGSATLVPTSYVTANTLAGNAWRNVVSIKIALLVTSNYVSTGGDDSLINEEENADFIAFKNQQIADGVQHVLLDQNISLTADNIIRRVVTTEVLFRNQQYNL